MLSQTAGQVLYALLTRPPPSPEGSSRLACVKHSVSVHPEPGSNSSFNLYNSVKFTDCFTPIYCCVCIKFIVVFALIVFLYSVANVLVYQCRSLTDKIYIITNNIFRQYFF